MRRTIGRYLRKRTRIQFGIECVLGPLKFQLMMTTVTKMDTVFMMNVNSRYLAMSGNTIDVGGRIFDTSKRNTTSDRRIEMPNVTFSPAWKNITIIAYMYLYSGKRDQK